MKLIHCLTCGDLFALRGTPRTCTCGASTGFYRDSVLAEVSGPCVSVAIGNGSLREAIARLSRLPPDRAFYPVMCWVRPSSGPTNPHTTCSTEAAE